VLLDQVVVKSMARVAPEGEGSGRRHAHLPPVELWPLAILEPWRRSRGMVK
jgi:hypothetical protein